MAGKYNRTVVGSICKGKDGSPDYLKLRGGKTAQDLAKALASADETKGLSLKLENKKQQLESLEAAVTAGKLSGDVVEKIRDRVNNIPEWVRFEVVLLSLKS